MRILAKKYTLPTKPAKPTKAAERLLNATTTTCLIGANKHSNQVKLKKKLNMDMCWFAGSSFPPTKLPGDLPSVVRSTRGDVLATVFPNDPCDPNIPHAAVVTAMMNMKEKPIRQSQQRRAARLNPDNIWRLLSEWEYKGRFPFRETIERDDPIIKQELLDLFTTDHAKPVRLGGYRITMQGRSGPNPTLRFEKGDKEYGSQHPAFLAHSVDNILPKKELMRALNCILKQLYETSPVQYLNLCRDKHFDGTNSKHCIFTSVYGKICNDLNKTRFDDQTTGNGSEQSRTLSPSQTLSPSKRLRIHFNEKESVEIPLDSVLITDFDILHGSVSTGTSSIDNTISPHRDKETNRKFNGMSGCGPVSGLMVRADRILKSGFPPSMCWLFYHKNDQQDWSLCEDDLQEFPFLTRYGYETYVLKKRKL